MRWKHRAYMLIYGNKRLLLSKITIAMSWLIGIFLLILAGDLQAEQENIQHDLHVAEVGDEIFTLKVPAGYQLELLTTDMQRPRLFIFDDAGNMLVGSRSGHIYRLPPPYNEPEPPLLILPDYPHSLTIRNGYLYIAQTSSLSRISYDPTEEILDESELEDIIPIPGGSGHNSRTLKIGPDKRLYLGLGITGNCSNEYLDNSYPWRDRRGGIMVLDETATPPVWKPWANGLRNPIGFDWHPDTGIMYASNNGPDHQGYEQPPEYFSKLEQNSFHGMPWYQYDGNRINRDNCIRSGPPRTDAVAPAATFPARSAPMDVHFITDGKLAKAYHGDALVALHGSWGTQPDGSGLGDPATRRPPKLVLVRFADGKATHVDDFITGFQNVRGARLARPMGLGTGPDGVLYFTSDGGINGLYRLIAQ